MTAAAAPVPAVAPRPHGNLDTATVEQIGHLADTIWPRRQPRAWLRRKGLDWLLGYLARQPESTWQECWLTSGLNEGSRRVRELTTGNQRLDVDDHVIPQG